MNRNAQPAPTSMPLDELRKRLHGIDKVVVAVHGIGSQTRSSTIRHVVRQFGDRSPGRRPLMPLGFFHFGPGVATYVSRFPQGPNDTLHRVGFVEVFWADIPRGVVHANDTLEETKAWARTIVSQAQATYDQKVERLKVKKAMQGKSAAEVDKALQKSGMNLRNQDFVLAAGVVDEIVETIIVLERLTLIADKAELFKFDLAPLLRDFVGDVQVVTEFEQYRKEIVFCFHRVMAHIERKFAECGFDMPNIYIVAHSEGTVVSFLGLLEALAGSQIAGFEIPNPKPHDEPKTVSASWIEHVKGFMTIGSPIDKHIVLWPRLWDRFRGRLAGARNFKIPWRNYYDFGDPVGFELDTAREFLKEEGCEAFEFDAKHDYGFSRYPLPGKAHNDYWQDPAVFGHFIDDVIERSKPPVPPPSRPWARFVSWTLPYLLVYVLHFACMYALFKGASGFLATKPTLNVVGRELLLLAALLMLVTMAARVPRLTRTFVARWPAFLVSAGLGAACIALLESTPEFVGNALAGWAGSRTNLEILGKGAIGIAALLVALTPLVIPRKQRLGRKILILVGGALALAAVLSNWQKAGSASIEVWPAVLGFAAFTYLWWLAILLFDLVFIWNRYIRQAIAVRALGHWYSRDDMDEASALKPGSKT